MAVDYFNCSPKRETYTLYTLLNFGAVTQHQELLFLIIKMCSSRINILL